MKTPACAFLLRLAAAALPYAVHADHRFGVMTHFAQGWNSSAVELVTRMAVPHVRDELYWAEVEPRPGEFVFPPAFDRYMAALAKQQVSPLIVLSFEHPHYDDGNTPHSDAGIAAYARYAVEVLRHYGPQIKAVEIWNEFNGSFARGPATQDRVDAYLRLLRATHAAIKRERPDVRVVAGATSGVPLPYWEKLLAGGVLDHADVLSVHPYRYETAPEGIEAELAAFRSLVRTFDRDGDTPVWVTEFGWFTRPSAAPGDLAIDEDTQARFLVRAFALLASVGVERAYWYLLHDWQGLNMGLFRDDANYTPRPAAGALATLRQQLRDARFVRRDASAPDFYSLVFARPNGEEVRVVWSLAPVRVNAAGVTAAVNWRGHSVTPDATLAVDDGPLFLTGSIGGLPPPPAPAATLARSFDDFSPVQGELGWSYGAFLRGSTDFTPLSAFVTTDWKKAWVGGYPALTITAGEQHPSVTGDTPIPAVRRWRSGHAGLARVTGSFRCGTSGDGVGVSITVDGQARLRAELGGGGRPIVQTFDFVTPLQVGTTLEFIVDPGAAAKIDYDATALAVTITREEP